MLNCLYKSDTTMCLVSSGTALPVRQVSVSTVTEAQFSKSMVNIHDNYVWLLLLSFADVTACVLRSLLGITDKRLEIN